MSLSFAFFLSLNAGIFHETSKCNKRERDESQLVNVHFGNNEQERSEEEEEEVNKRETLGFKSFEMIVCIC